MKWYFAINEAGLLRYAQMIAVACASARENTQLEPVMLYDGNANVFIDRLQKSGVHVVQHTVGFLDKILGSKAGGGYSPQVARGAYLRLEVANVEKSAEFVLYTDVDVIFRSSFEPPSPCSSVFAACPEVWTGGSRPAYVKTVFNSGVMLINVAEFRENYEELLQFAARNEFYFHGKAGFYDQGALNQFFEGKWEKLDPDYNCRVFIGDVDHAKILHCHGTKPYEIEFLQNGDRSKIGETALKIYNWSPDSFAELLKVYRSYIPSWWEDVRREMGGNLFGTRSAAEA